MLLLYTKKKSEGNFFLSSYLNDFKQISLTPQAIHLFNNTAIYFDNYPRKFKFYHINHKMKSSIFLNIDKIFFKNDKTGKESYVYVIHIPDDKKSKITFITVNETNPVNGLKSLGIINSQIAAVNKIVQTLNQDLKDTEFILKGFK